MSRLLLLSLVCALAQPAPSLYRLTISVADGRGRALTGLVASDVVVTVGDVERAATGLEPDPRPLSIVVIADGVEPTEALNVRVALTGVLRRLRAGGADVRIGLMLGEEGARAPTLEGAQAAASDHDRRVSRFFSTPETAPPADTILGASQALAREEGRRKAVLVMSINRRGASTQSFAAVVSAMRRADIALVAVETGDGPDQSLWLIHNALGGRFERIGDAAAFDSVAARLAGALMSAYQVTFSAGESGNRPLKVQVKGHGRVTVIAPAWGMR
jgi:hypothetical protein